MKKKENKYFKQKNIIKIKQMAAKNH